MNDEARRLQADNAWALRCDRKAVFDALNQAHSAIIAAVELLDEMGDEGESYAAPVDAAVLADRAKELARMMRSYHVVPTLEELCEDDDEYSEALSWLA